MMKNSNAGNKRPCTNCPNPGIKKLHTAATTFQPDPCPACIIFPIHSFIMRLLAYCIAIHRRMLIIDADRIARHFLLTDFSQITQLIQALWGIADQFIKPCNRLGRQCFVLFFSISSLKKCKLLRKLPVISCTMSMVDFSTLNFSSRISTSLTDCKYCMRAWCNWAVLSRCFSAKIAVSQITNNAKKRFAKTWYIGISLGGDPQ